MKLFINSGVFDRMWNGNVKIKKIAEQKKVCLSIPNYLEETHEIETINFLFSDEIIDAHDFNKEGYEHKLDNISLKQESKNSYHINLSNDDSSNDSSKKVNDQCMYALLRCASIVPDDIFIPASKKDKIEVLRRIRFIDDEADLGDFLSNVYLIKITLKYHESIPVYLTCTKPYVLNKHYVFYKNET